MGCTPPSKRPNEISETILQRYQMNGSKENLGVQRKEVKKYI